MILSLNAPFKDFFIEADFAIDFLNSFGFLPTINEKVKASFDLTFLNSLNFIFFFVDHSNFLHPSFRFFDFLTIMTYVFHPFIKYIFSISEPSLEENPEFFLMLRCLKFLAYSPFAWFDNAAKFSLFPTDNFDKLNADFFFFFAGTLSVTGF